MQPTLMLQPEGSSLCGQTCVAMAAGVSLDRAIDAVGHSRATDTREIVKALRSLGIPCADRMRRLSAVKPVMPARGLLYISRPKGSRPARHHWMLNWDGHVYDPAGAWPNYPGWRITSYLEIQTH